MNKQIHSYLTKPQAVEKYPFLTANMLKNLLFKNLNGFRDKVVKKLGRRILLDEEALLNFISRCPSDTTLGGTDVEPRR
jgi:hypothetical protein